MEPLTQSAACYTSDMAGLPVPAMSDSERRAALRRFLCDARARIDPRRIGLTWHGKRRVPELRRDEVAQLIDVSDVWYTRFETGRGRLALKTISRLADVLGLDARERATLFALARAELAYISSGAASDAFSGCDAYLTALRDLARTARHATTTVEFAEATTRGIAFAFGPLTLGYWQSVHPAEGVFRFDAVDGRYADRLAGYVQGLDTVAHVLPRLERGETVGEANLAASPSDELRARIGMVDTRAYLAHPLVAPDGLRFAFGAAWRDPQEPLPSQLAFLEAVGTIAELSFAGL
jgi:transcriptional regulator with XRE-family HTH domain